MAVNQSKNSTTGYNQKRPGQGYTYDSYLNYDELTDPLSGNAVLYDQIGTASTPSNVAKNSASPTNLAKS